MFRPHLVWSFLQPRRPRHPIVSALMGLFAICAFIVLLVVGAAVAAVVMIAGLLLRALRPSRPPAQMSHARAAPSSGEGDFIDAEYSVLRKPGPGVAGR
jgi:hypothetical protein